MGSQSIAGQSEAEDATKTTTGRLRRPGLTPRGRGFCLRLRLALAGYVLKTYCSSEPFADPANAAMVFG